MKAIVLQLLVLTDYYHCFLVENIVLPILFDTFPPLVEFASDKYWVRYLFFLHTSHPYVYMYFDVCDIRVQKLRQKAKEV